MSGSTDSLHSTDRNLLFGILALQMNFVTKDALISAMNTWIQNKERPLSQILQAHGALRPNDQTVIDQLVDKHVVRHDVKAEMTYSTLPVAHHVGDAHHRQTEPGPQYPAGLVHTTLMAPNSNQND